MSRVVNRSFGAFREVQRPSAAACCTTGSAASQTLTVVDAVASSGVGSAAGRSGGLSMLPTGLHMNWIYALAFEAARLQVARDAARRQAAAYN